MFQYLSNNHSSLLRNLHSFITQVKTICNQWEGQDYWKNKTFETAHILFSNTLSYPRTVMIIPMDAKIATIAMYCPQRSYYFARHAVPQVRLKILTQFLRTWCNSRIRKPNLDIRICIKREGESNYKNNLQFVFLLCVRNYTDSHRSKEENGYDESADENDNFFRWCLQCGPSTYLGSPSYRHLTTIVLPKCRFSMIDLESWV